MENRWIKNFNKCDNCKLRIFCFPHAGGTAQDYKKWAMYLPDEVELYALQLPGRAERMQEGVCQSFDTIINEIVKHILMLLDKPYVFVGHSFGASVAFEVAKSVRRLGYQIPKHLFLIGRGGPNIVEYNPKYRLPDERFIEHLKELSGRRELFFSNIEIIKYFLPMIRNDMRLAETYHAFYRKESPLSCPIHVFWGTNEVSLKHEGLEDWRGETSDLFTIDQFEGHHFFLHENTEVVLKKMFGYISPEC